MLQSVKSGGSLARNARFGAPTCLVSRHWFDGGFAVSMGEAAKRLLLEGFQEGCHVVLPGVALCDIPACLITCRKCQTWRKSRTKMLVFLHLRVSSRVSGFPVASPCLYGGSCKICTFRRFPSRLSCCFACLFDNVSKMSKLEDVSHEMLVFLRPRVSSRVSGFPVASACLWGKLQNVSFSKVSKQVVMLFSVAGMALCDIPTCLITCRKYQNWRKSRTKCLFFCAHVFRLESLVFLWRRRVYGESCKMCPFRRFPSRLSSRFASTYTVRDRTDADV